MGRIPWSQRIGQTFGRITVLGVHWRQKTRGRVAYVLGACSCGAVVDVLGGNLTGGLTRSCGCLSAEARSRKRPVSEDRRAEARKYRELRRAAKEAKKESTAGVRQWVRGAITQKEAVYEYIGARNMMTKEVADGLHISVRTASAVLCALEADGRVRKVAFCDGFEGAWPALWEQA
jgi:hypothetical protein